MKTYILIAFTIFKKHEDIEKFTIDILSKITSVQDLRYMIESDSNLIVIFDSDLDYKTISDDIFEKLVLDEVKCYLIFERDSIISAHIPTELNNFIFKMTGDKSFSLNYEVQASILPLTLDGILEKINTSGVKSLTTEEKIFLDNFNN